MFKKLAQQLKAQATDNVPSMATSPIKNTDKSLLKNLSCHALNLYERKTDIKNFTKLALSNPENKSHNKIMDELFTNKSVVDAFDDEKLFELSENKRFLEDLGYQD